MLLTDHEQAEWEITDIIGKGKSERGMLRNESYLLWTESHFLLLIGGHCCLPEVALFLYDRDSRRYSAKCLCHEASLTGTQHRCLKDRDRGEEEIWWGMHVPTCVTELSCPQVTLLWLFLLSSKGLKMLHNKGVYFSHKNRSKRGKKNIHTCGSVSYAIDVLFRFKLPNKFSSKCNFLVLNQMWWLIYALTVKLTFFYNYFCYSLDVKCSFLTGFAITLQDKVIGEFLSKSLWNLFIKKKKNMSFCYCFVVCYCIYALALKRKWLM